MVRGGGIICSKLRNSFTVTKGQLFPGDDTGNVALDSEIRRRLQSDDDGITQEIGIRRHGGQSLGKESISTRKIR